MADKAVFKGAVKAKAKTAGVVTDTTQNTGIVP
jgi:hypothetical protein